MSIEKELEKRGDNIIGKIRLDDEEKFTDNPSTDDEENLLEDKPGDEYFIGDPPPVDEESPDDEEGPDDEKGNLIVEIDGYRIEEGIEIPSIRQKKSHTWHKLMMAMKIGQSIPFESKKDAAAFTSFLHKNNIPHTSRTDGKGMRVWKIRKQNKKEVTDSG